MGTDRVFYSSGPKEQLDYMKQTFNWGPVTPQRSSTFFKLFSSDFWKGQQNKLKYTVHQKKLNKSGYYLDCISYKLRENYLVRLLQDIEHDLSFAGNQIGLI